VSIRLYLDACCLSRLTDDQSQPRVREEAEAMERILDAISDGRAVWVSSTVLEIEIGHSPREDRRGETAALLVYANETVVPGAQDDVRAESLQAFGFGQADALHLACAESAGVNVFLTTDDRLLRRARRCAHLLRVRVENPVSWYREVLA
jgi:predicted nucleic acid-binding protein